MNNQEKERIKITLNENDIKRLEDIRKALNKRFSFELTKSQTLQFLISKFKLENEESKTIQKPTFKAPTFKALTSSTSTEESRQESKRKLLLLRNTLKVSNKELSDLLNINFESMRKYLQGKREPQGENAEKIQKMYEKYGII